MANSFNKKEIEKNKQKKKKEKQLKKAERKKNPKQSFESMIAYIDENGMITDTPPDMEKKKEKIKLEDIAISIPKKEKEEVDPVLKGRVEFFNEAKGYGFIKDLNSVEKYFFHVSNAPDLLKEGDKVTFELERGPKGMNAVKIVITK